eukprot:SAG31_NODE_220_length_19925_cov_3.630939_19_plen_652_part_00
MAAEEEAAAKAVAEKAARVKAKIALHDADELYDRGEYNAAVQLYQDALRLTTGDPELTKLIKEELSNAVHKERRAAFRLADDATDQEVDEVEHESALAAQHAKTYDDVLLLLTQYKLSAAVSAAALRRIWKTSAAEQPPQQLVAALLDVLEALHAEREIQYLGCRLLERLAARGQAALLGEEDAETVLLATLKHFTERIRDDDGESDSDEADECEYDEDEDVVEIACHALYYLARENPPSRLVLLRGHAVQLLDAAEGRFGARGPYAKLIELITDGLREYFDGSEQDDQTDRALVEKKIEKVKAQREANLRRRAIGLPMEATDSEVEAAEQEQRSRQALAAQSVHLVKSQPTFATAVALVNAHRDSTLIAAEVMKRCGELLGLSKALNNKGSHSRETPGKWVPGARVPTPDKNKPSKDDGQPLAEPPPNTSASKSQKPKQSNFAERVASKRVGLAAKSRDQAQLDQAELVRIKEMDMHANACDKQGDREPANPKEAAKSAVAAFAHFCATGCLQKFPNDRAVQSHSVRVLYRLIEQGQAEPVAEAGGVTVLLSVAKRLPIMHHDEQSMGKLNATAAWKKECNEAKGVYEALNRLTELHLGSQAVAKASGGIRTLEEAKAQWCRAPANSGAASNAALCASILRRLRGASRIA